MTRRALRVGLTGGIGSGKSTVSARLAALGAAVVDADLVAREVVQPGMPALAAIRDRFGPAVLTADGCLDRPALGRLVFGDSAALRDLEAITHPAIWARTAELMTAAAESHDVLVHDMPLLVEKAMSADYHLVVVVGASEETRLRRLVEQRGMSQDDAQARIAAQADDAARHAATDAWLDNEGTPAELISAVDTLWHSRIRPFADNLRVGRPAPANGGPSAEGGAVAGRLAVARIRHVLGPRAGHVRLGSGTGGPGTTGDGDTVTVQLDSAVSAEDADVVADLAAAGFVPVDGGHDGGHVHRSCDPQAPVVVRVLGVGTTSEAAATSPV